MALRPLFDNDDCEDLGTCPIHENVKLVRSMLPGGDPICPECARLTLEELAYKHDLEASNQMRQHFLQKWSLVDDWQTFDESNFENYKTIPGSREEWLKSEVIDNAKELLTVPMQAQTMILCGPPGVGKTHLAVATLKYLQKHSNQTCLFINVNALLRHIKNSFDNPQEFWTQTNAIQQMQKADLLCLDDLGTESAMAGVSQATNFVQNILYEVLNVQRRVIITSNLTEQQMKMIYNPKLVSRIFKNSLGTVYDFTGIEDKRRNLRRWQDNG